MAANYVLLERIELNASAASLTFANIPQSGYTDLKVVLSIRSDSTDLDTLISFNGSAASFSGKRLYGSGSAVASDSVGRSAGLVNMTSYTALTFANNEFYIPNYVGSANKSFSVDSVTENNATAAYSLLAAGLWSNTAAITSITIAPSLGNFVANSTFSLYGLAALGTTPVIAPKATGGNITTDGTYWYHTFLSSGTFTPATALSCDALVVAGGGGGFFSGAGAGGLLAYTSQTFASSTSYGIAIGAGGAAGSNATGFAGQGNNSSVTGLTAPLGGGRGVGGSLNGVSGGSGSGSCNNTAGSYGTGTSGQGNNGGTGNWGTPSYTGGGGGGAGAAGSDAGGGDPPGGAGGAGLNTYSTWASATGTGVSGYYAGGGGGGKSSGGSGGTAGAGGGGAGSTGGTGSAGTANTGGGGGGGNGAGGAGGSGIVIIRYAMA